MLGTDSATFSHCESERGENVQEYNKYHFGFFVVGGLGFELCVFVAGWRHALRSEWPFIIIIILDF